MKKILFATLLIVGISQVSKAQDIFVDFGKLSLHVPVLSGVQASFGYDFKGGKSQGLAETPVAKWNFYGDSVFVFTVGACTTEDNSGAPFASVNYEIKGMKNPIPGITDIHPGVYGGHDFHTNTDFYGLKASINLF